MADITVFGNDHQALPRKYKDMGDSTYAEVVYSASVPGPSLRQPAPAAPTLLQAFQSGHGFAKAAGTGSQTDDLVDFVAGSQSLKITTLGDASAFITQKSSISPTINLTGKQLRIVFKVDSSAANIADFSLYLSSDNGATNNYHQSLLTIINAVTQPYAQDGEWVTYTLNFNELDSTGSPDRTAINFMKIRVQDKNSLPVNVHVQSITAEAEPANAVCSIVFDDGWQSTYTIAAPYLATKGLRATSTLIRDLIGQASYLTLAQAKALQDFNGFDIACHADTVAVHNASGAGTPPVGIDDATLLGDQQNIKKFLIQNGFRRSDVYAWPHGYFTATQMANAKTLFSEIRGVCGGQRGTMGPHETYPPGDPYRLRSWLIASTDGLANVQAALAAAVANKTWLILTFHQIVPSGASGGTQINTALWQTMIDAIITSGIKVKTIAEVFENGVA